MRGENLSAHEVQRNAARRAQMEARSNRPAPGDRCEVFILAGWQPATVLSVTPNGAAVRVQVDGEDSPCLFYRESIRAPLSPTIPPGAGSPSTWRTEAAEDTGGNCTMCGDQTDTCDCRE